MKTSAALRSLGACAAVSALASCAAPSPQSRIARDPQSFEALSPHQRSLVMEGRIEKGLPKAGVHFAWGRPDRIAQWDRSGRTIERWTYSALRPIYVQTVGVGVGWGHYRRGGWYDPGWYGGTDVAWVPYTSAWVDFTGGRVSEWEVQRSRP